MSQKKRLLSKADIRRLIYLGGGLGSPLVVVTHGFAGMNEIEVRSMVIGHGIVKFLREQAEARRASFDRECLFQAGLEDKR
ncbi:MAG TPA: hypothetical protein VMV33_17330 [Rhodocyclaceae bacterium]|nr:hypothetical protein [Rhodocyclaceae bacterium]